MPDDYTSYDTVDMARYILNNNWDEDDFGPKPDIKALHQGATIRREKVSANKIRVYHIASVEESKDAGYDFYYETDRLSIDFQGVTRKAVVLMRKGGRMAILRARKRPDHKAERFQTLLWKGYKDLSHEEVGIFHQVGEIEFRATSMAYVV